MKKLLCPLAALALSGCAGLSGVTAPPVQVAGQTVLDEQGAIGVELAYKAARLAMETAVDAGLLKGETAAKAAELDNAAFAAVITARATYRAGNATSYAAALSEARTAITNMLNGLR